MKGKAFIVGAYEHPTRHAVDRSLAQLHADVARGAWRMRGWASATWMDTFAPATYPGGMHRV